MKGAVGVDGCVRKSSGTIASDSAAPEALQTKGDVFIEKAPKSTGADTAAFLGSLERSRGRGCTGSRAQRVSSFKFDAREDAVSKPVHQAEYFIVAKARIESDLGDQVRRRIERVGRCCVVAVACAGFSQQEVAGVAVRGQRPLRIFHRKCHRNLVVEGLGQADAVLAREIESDVIGRVN